MANAKSLKDADRSGIIHPHGTLATQADKPVNLMVSADRITLTDSEGKNYLDAGAGLWCCNVGYGRQELADACSEQLIKTSFLHSFSNFTNEPLVRLSKRLLDLAPDHMTRVLYGCSGSDANDTQLKLVRRYNNVRGLPDKKKIISRWGSYHGSTLASGSLTGLDVIHRTFDLPIDGVRHTVCPDYYRNSDQFESERAYSRYLADELEKMILEENPDTVAAFIAEPISGAGGIYVPPEGYFEYIHEVLDRYDILLIADEVITAFGRTGHWFASPALGIKPDLMTLSKGITSGYYPMSASLISKRVADVLYGDEEMDGYFAHGFTSTGHPAASAVALANIDIIERENLLENSREVGGYLKQKIIDTFAGHQLVGDVRGMGLMIGVEFDQDSSIKKPFDDPIRVAGILSQACFDEGLILRGSYGKVFAAMAPPLVLTHEDADEIVARLELAIDRFAKEIRSECLVG